MRVAGIDVRIRRSASGSTPLRRPPITRWRTEAVGVERDPAVRGRQARGIAYYPRDAEVRADINHWMLVGSGARGSRAATSISSSTSSSHCWGPARRGGHREGSAELASAGRHPRPRLAKPKWLTGDSVTLADIAVAAPMHLHDLQRLPLADHPNLKRWMTQGVEQLPSWKSTQAAVDNALRPKQSLERGSDPRAAGRGRVDASETQWRTRTSSARPSTTRATIPRAGSLVLRAAAGQRRSAAR